jgi:penicillin-binding protein 1A
MAIAGIACLSLIAVAGFTLAVYAAWLFHDLPDAGQLAEYRPPTSTRVYAWDGTLIGEIGKERRIFAPYDQIPPLVARAFLAAEDRKFFEHGGIDINGLGRAITRDMIGALQGRRLQGGSTITQQVAKNILLTNEHSFGRKIKEAILARRIEAALPKTRILELYLNEIWLGYRSYGVGAAAYNYFGKPLSELSLPEMAYLASLPKGPSNYDPIKHRTEALRRRNWVLSQMAEENFITRAQAEAAMREDLKVQIRPERAHYRDADYFMEEVRQRAFANLGKKAEEGGLYIRTTLDSRMQTAARVALMKGLELYDRRHGWRGALEHVDLNAAGWEKELLSKTPASERRTWRAAVVEKAGGGAVHLKFADGTVGDLVGADVAWAKAGKGLNAGDLIFVEPTGAGKWFNLRQVPAVNGALVAVEPHSGRVLAMVGGYSFSLSKFNRATQAQRQPGSSFKPFVYAAALENGFTPASIVLDAPVHFAGADGDVWSPENYGHGSAGPSIFRSGLVYSRNQMTVRIADKVGMRKISDFAVKAGVADKLDPVLAMALGAGETTPFRITSAYSAFANGGRRIDPHLIEIVQDRTGAPIWQVDKRDCPKCGGAFTGEESPRLPPDGLPIMDPITAYSLTLMLEGVTTNGTAAAVSSLGRHIAGKTGTTNDYRSAWFVGYTPSLVVGVFVGFDDNRSLGEGETGAQASVPIFIDFMRDILKDAPQEDFKAPRGAKMAMVGGRWEAFQPGTEPKLVIAPRPSQITEPLAGPGVEAAPPVVPPSVAASVNAHPLMMDAPPASTAKPAPKPPR